MLKLQKDKRKKDEHHDSKYNEHKDDRDLNNDNQFDQNRKHDKDLHDDHIVTLKITILKKNQKG